MNTIVQVRNGLFLVDPSSGQLETNQTYHEWIPLADNLKLNLLFDLGLR